MKLALDSTDWDTLLANDDDVINVSNILSTALINAAITTNVPKFTNHAQRTTRQEKNLLKERKKMTELLNQRNVRTQDSERATNKIKDIDTQINNLIIKSQENTERRLINNISANPKAFFKHTNSTRKFKTKIGPLICPITHNYLDGPKEMAEILSQQYKSVFTVPCTNPSATNFPSLNCNNLSDIDVTLESIIAAGKSICLSSAPGPDGIPPIIFHDYIEVLARPIKRIIRMSLDSGKLPEPNGIAQAIIAPMLKPGGTKSNAADYRPIALTNHLTKLIERIIRMAIIEHLEENLCFNKNQHGFVPGKSTITQLLKFYDDLLFLLEMGNDADVIYLDFAKAFDKVDHGVVLKKLKQLKIEGKLHLWIKSFLRSKHQRVKVDDILSDPVKVISGVPQGSVLGPLLFVILMLDIDQNLSYVYNFQFADDTKLLKGITSPADHNHLQMQLSNVYTWAHVNGMLFNEKKFDHMALGTQIRVVKYNTPSGTPIKRKHAVKDLGFTMQDNLWFDTHIQNIVTKGHQMSGWVLRTIKSRKTIPMKVLLKSLVISQLEYACLLWGPFNQKQINQLESVQKRFTSRFACFISLCPIRNITCCTVAYKDRLKALEIFSLDRRRERYYILYIYKLAIGIVPDLGLDFYQNARGHQCVRSKVIPDNIHTRHIPRWVKNSRNSSFFVMGPRLYNNLPPNLRTKALNQMPPKKSSVHSFKAQLDAHPFLTSLD